MFSVKPFKSILDLLKAFPDEQSCIDHLEYLRWDGNIVSPFDSESKVYKCKGNKYKCLNTNKYFNVRTGTIFEGSKIPLQQWILAIYLFSTNKKGISSYTLASELNLTQKTSWFLLSRIRYAMEHETFLREMEGVVQVDETFVGGKNKNRHKDKKVKNSQGRSFKDKTPVIGFLSEGQVKCEVIADTSSDSISPSVINNVAKGSIIVTDEWRGYNNLNTEYHREIVSHERGSYLNENGFTTNGIEGFWSEFKKTLIGTYHNRQTKKHLKLYTNESVYRYNFREKTTSEKVNLLLQNTNGKRLTYQALIGNVQR
jgi:transposase-like protein